MILALDSDMAWAIGLFEGEGSIVKGRGNQTSLVVQMSDKDVIDKFFSIVKVGTLAGPYQPKGKPSYRQTWRWSTSNADNVGHLLSLWIPHLGARRKSIAMIALERSTKVYRKLNSMCCPKGHEWAIYEAINKKTGKRQCKECNRIRARRYR